MKREAKKLLSKAIDSLILAVEHFNRPDGTGRAAASLLFLDHAMEMFLKAAIVERKGSINSKDRPGHKIGFDACVSRCLSDSKVLFLTEDQAKLLRMINGQRDAAQHYLVDLSEQVLYVHLQAGVMVFKDMLRKVFSIELSSYLPDRVLPISTLPPLDLHLLFDQEINAIRQMLIPGNRKRVDTEARLRSLIIIDKALTGGDVQQPNSADTRRREQALSNGSDWHSIFPGVASVQIHTEGSGHTINLVIKKQGDGLPAYIIDKSQAADEAVIAIQRVNDFDRYSMPQLVLAEHLGINSFQVQALVWHLGIKDNKDAYKEFRRGTVVIRGYSLTALQICRNTLDTSSLDEICDNYKAYIKTKRRAV